MDFWHFLKELTDPESIIRYGGLTLLLVVVFSETGLMIGFFLPGDSLIFVSGLICSTKPDLLNVHISVLILSMISAAVLGNMAGYWFGKRVGPALFKREDSLIFKKRYLEATKTFYARHGGKALVFGRFLPVIRTFAPILAGVIAIDFRRFMIYNLLGAAAWIGSLGLLGYYLGNIEWVRDNVGWIVVFLIVITMFPVAAVWKKSRSGAKPGIQSPKS